RLPESAPFPYTTLFRSPIGSPAMEPWPGQPFPLGATYDGAGTNFSVFSEVAESVELCLFDESNAETRVPLPEMTAFCWHGYFQRSEEHTSELQSLRHLV